MKKYILISLISATLFSCIKTLDFDDEGLANQLVLNSIIWPDSAFVASLTKSTSILTERQIGQSTDGVLDLYENGALLAHLTSSAGQFRAADIKPKAGKSYKMVVTSNGKQMEAETTIPLKAEAISMDTATVFDENGSKKLNYKVKIKDPIGYDFYRIVVTTENLTLVYNSESNGTRKYYLQKNKSYITSDDPVFNSVFNNFGGETLDVGPSNEDFIFPDDYFRNKEYSINFQAYSYGYNTQDYYYQNPNNPKEYQGVKNIYERNIVYVQKLSKELYNYMKYMNLYDYYHDNPFSEPVPVYANVKDGIGIFAGFNDDTRLTSEKIYVPYSMDTITVEKNNNGYGGSGGYGGYGGY